VKVNYLLKAREGEIPAEGEVKSCPKVKVKSCPKARGEILARR
jgi:hypothetical protein